MNKETECQLTITNAERHTLYNLMARPSVACPGCNTQPIDTTTVARIRAVSRLWDILKLDDFLSEAPTEEEDDTFTLDSGAAKLLAEIVVSQAPNLIKPNVVLVLMRQILGYIDAAGLELPGDKTPAESRAKEIAFTDPERAAIKAVLNKPVPCETKFNTGDGNTVLHGTSKDIPRSLGEYRTFIRLASQFDAGVSLDTETAAYLADLVARRSAVVGVPIRQLAAIVDKL